MGKRRANNEGSIWQRQDGRWTGAAYVLTSEGILKRTYVYGRTREDVHGKLVKMQDRSAQGIPVPAKAWKVGEYLDYWLTEVAARSVRPTTYAKYEVMIRLYLKPGLGRHRLDRLRRYRADILQQPTPGRRLGRKSPRSPERARCGSHPRHA